MQRLSLKKMSDELLSMNSWFNENNIDISNFQLDSFTQVWSSTALGFPGCGGSAITSATTYVFMGDSSVDYDCFIFFAGEFAYRAPDCRKLWIDVSDHNMAPVMMSDKYRKEE